MKYFSLYETPAGIGGVAATDGGLCNVWLPADPALPGNSLCSSALTDTAAQLLRSYFTGAATVDFSRLPLDLSLLPSFQQKVLLLVRDIPSGSVTTYGLLAEMLGDKAKARGVGSALAANPVPIVIPCHRVVATSGKLTGFSAPGGIRTKKLLLEQEGIVIVREQTVMKSAGFAQMFFGIKK